MNRTVKQYMAVDLAGIRWLSNEIENRAMERYMGSRANLPHIVRVLREARQKLAAITDKNTVGLADDAQQCPWDWCCDFKCLPDCDNVDCPTSSSVWLSLARSED